MNDQDLGAIIREAHAARDRDLTQWAEAMHLAARYAAQYAESGNRATGRLSTRARRAADALAELINEVQGRSE